MNCPACGEHDTKVIDSRMLTNGGGIRRRRECGVCDFRFSTIEEIQILDLSVIKRDGMREPYSRSKLSNGLKKSFEKRPISNDDFLRLLQIIERDIQILKKSEVTTGEIGEIVMKRLKRIDEVAYIRFASVYQAFPDVKSFHNAIEQLFKKPAKRIKREGRKHKK
jgi:transcriptional repressor NrdR